MVTADNGPWRGALGGSVLSRSVPDPKFAFMVCSQRSQGKIPDGQRAVDFSTGTVGEACQNSDVVVVASPVDRIAELVVSAAEHRQTTA